MSSKRLCRGGHVEGVEEPLMSSKRLCRGGHVEGVHYHPDPATGCWNWTGRLNQAGYPFRYAYRRAWERVNGPRPDGYDIHHVCRNRKCVNPDHLEAIAPRDHDIEHFLHERAGLTLDEIREVVLEVPQEQLEALFAVPRDHGQRSFERG